MKSPISDFVNYYLHIVIKYAIIFVSESFRLSQHSIFSRAFCKAVKDAENDKSAKNKSEEINTYEGRIRKHLPHLIKYGKRARKVRTDVEHIKRILYTES